MKINILKQIEVPMKQRATSPTIGGQGVMRNIGASI